MVVRLNLERSWHNMKQLVLTNGDGIIIDSAKVSNEDELLETLAKWLTDYEFLDGDSISFYDI